MSAEYENWGNSRWEFTKSQSKWHFDKNKLPKLGQDSYLPVCNFAYDFADIIAECLPKTKASSWSSRNDFDKTIAEQGLYSASAEENDLLKAGADPKAEVFSRAKADDILIFRQIADILGIIDPTIKFHNQTTGQMLHLHIDNFAGRQERENSFKVTDIDTNPNLMRRFAIMLADWEMGQAWMFGNNMYWGWRAGDCITWDWRDMPHATVNAGWHNRPLLQITGYTTDRTREIIDLAESNIRNNKPLEIIGL